MEEPYLQEENMRELASKLSYRFAILMACVAIGGVTLVGCGDDDNGDDETEVDGGAGHGGTGGTAGHAGTGGTGGTAGMAGHSGGTGGAGTGGTGGTGEDGGVETDGGEEDAG